MTARSEPVEIFDRRTGETWAHLSTTREGSHYVTMVRNETTGQVATCRSASPKFSLLDALVACGCHRKTATEAAQLSRLW